MTMAVRPHLHAHPWSSCADGEAEAEDVRGLRPQAAKHRAGVGGQGAVVRGVWGGGGGGVPLKNRQMCEGCGLKQSKYGLASEGKTWWCAGCGAAKGAVKPINYEKAARSDLRLVLCVAPHRERTSRCDARARRSIRRRIESSIGCELRTDVYMETQ
jgi:hypothetical protein